MSLLQKKRAQVNYGLLKCNFAQVLFIVVPVICLFVVCFVYWIQFLLHLGTKGQNLRENKYKAHRKFGDRRGGVTSARTYFYADEAKCDQHMETFLKCIKASGEQ